MLSSFEAFEGRDVLVLESILAPHTGPVDEIYRWSSLLDIQLDINGGSISLGSGLEALSGVWGVLPHADTNKSVTPRRSVSRLLEGTNCVFRGRERGEWGEEWGWEKWPVSLPHSSSGQNGSRIFSADQGEHPVVSKFRKDVETSVSNPFPLINIPKDLQKKPVWCFRPQNQNVPIFFSHCVFPWVVTVAKESAYMRLVFEKKTTVESVCMKLLKWSWTNSGDRVWYL